MQGWSDNPINETGEKQFHTLAQQQKSEENLDIIVSSDLLRAKQSAEILAAELKLPIIYSEYHRERNHDALEGMTENEINNKFPNLNW